MHVLMIQLILTARFIDFVSDWVLAGRPLTAVHLVQIVLFLVRRVVIYLVFAFLVLQTVLRCLVAVAEELLLRRGRLNHLVVRLAVLVVLDPNINRVVFAALLLLN